MALLYFIWSGWLEPPVGIVAIFIGACVIFVCVIILVFSLREYSRFISRSNKTVPYEISEKSPKLISRTCFGRVTFLL